MDFQPGYSRPGYSVSVNGVRRQALPATPTIPPGGRTGEVLVKLSSADYHYTWMSLEVLTKAQRNEETGDFILNEDGAILLND